MNQFIPPFYTVESVTSGHPDKVCDQISDAILDECLRQDSRARVAIEVFGGHGTVVIGGEVTCKGQVDYEKIARAVYRDIGYTDELEVIVRVAEQSPDIAQGVDTGGAGDQGIMYGFATEETPEYMPKGTMLAHKLARGLEELRKGGVLSWLKPDGKTQVTIKDHAIAAILVSAQHDSSVAQEEMRSSLMEHLIQPAVGDVSSMEILVNPTGKFESGGFEADTGLTGRKIMVDTYGGFIPHGGGCFSGKDSSKVDRSAAYMCRFAAKNLVAHKYAKQCLVSVAYAIGRAEPLMVDARNEKGDSLAAIARQKFDFRPQAIVERLGLRQPVFQQTAAYGHFGRESFPWEKVLEQM